jgi:hypothetical protein
MLDERLRRSAEGISPPEPALERLQQRRRGRERNRRVSSAATALVLTVGVLGGLLFTIRELGPASGRDTYPGGSGTAGDTATSQPSPLAPGQYFYERSVRLIPDTAQSDGGRVTEETWWSVDGSGRRVAHSTTESYGVAASGTWGPGDFPATENLTGLSTDPDVLGGQLGARSSPGGASPQPAISPGPGQSAESGVLWRAVTDLFEMPNAEPALRWALFQVAADIPGVEMLEDVEDPVGRDAVGLRIVAEGAERTLFFDPATLQPMASTEDYGEGEVWQRIVVTAGVVGSTDATPTGEERFLRSPPEPLA